MNPYADIVEPDFVAAYGKCQPLTMTSIERLYALFNAVRYVAASNIDGAFAECGVWKGGSVMMIAYTLLSLGIKDRDIYLFDTFDGMTAPTDVDVSIGGQTATSLLEKGEKESDLVWAYSPLDEVRNNLEKTGYPMDRFILVKGDVMATIPENAPADLALLRLDTDWHDSTRHELIHLFPRLARRGILIIDDYGHYQGARKAVDDYLAELPTSYLLHRIDYTGRVLVKA